MIQNQGKHTKVVVDVSRGVGKGFGSSYTGRRGKLLMWGGFAGETAGRRIDHYA